jgi:hypothetical protein
MEVTRETTLLRAVRSEKAWSFYKKVLSDSVIKTRWSFDVSEEE